MENNYSNYDMLDKMIANNKKAKSWTAFWVTILCVMAGAVLWLAFTVSEKNKTISKKNEVITANQLSLEQKSQIIDSLTLNCNVAKTAIIREYDSAITKTQTALTIVTDNANRNTTEQLTAAEKQKIKEANTSIEKVKTSIKTVKANMATTPSRLFIQFNNAEEGGRVNKFQSILKAFTEYIIAPPELINKDFGTVIKFYNYQDVKDDDKAKEEKLLINLIAKQFDISRESIQVTYHTNQKIKKTIELWIDTRPAAQSLKMQ